MRGVAIALALAGAVVAQDGDEVGEFPEGFLAQNLDLEFDQPVGLTFADDGRMLVWEKAGRVWTVTGGVKAAAPLIDIQEEVGNWSSNGLMGLALDPDFLLNGHVYLLYTVDKHHLLHFGTASYDPDADDFYEPTIGRITRYTANAWDDFQSVDLASRHVLLGDDVSDGMPVLHEHGVASLAFGHDGSLLASCGDGATALNPDTGASPEAVVALADGILTPAENVGAYRAQLVDSLNGKVLRLHPGTGAGISSNPFFDPADPSSARSRVWAYGLRNPYKLHVEPGTDTSGPGTIVIGDDGACGWEELNVSLSGGENFGWPLYEGYKLYNTYANVEVANLTTPNPLFGVNGCTQEFIAFNDLLVQNSLNPYFWANACDDRVPIPPSALPSVHRRPLIDWGHVKNARTGIFDGFGEADVIDLDDPLSPIPTDEPFQGSCSIAGSWYAGTSYPEEWQDSYYHADFTNGWIRQLATDPLGGPLEVRTFGKDLGPVVAMASDPVSGDLHYINFSATGIGGIYRIAYFADNEPPTAVAAIAQAYGAEPFVPDLDAAPSLDPEGVTLDYSWSFGDGTPTNAMPAPRHVFPSEDATTAGGLGAHVLELDPPQVGGSPPLDISVVNDGVYPPVGIFSLDTQYVTSYFGKDDKGGIDWLAYEYPAERVFHGLSFQEGSHFVPDGGWFDTLSVQARVAGEWFDVTGLTIAPDYEGNDGFYAERYDIQFDSIAGDAIRLVGDAGGNLEFVTVSEMRVIASPVAPVGVPARYDVTLTVTDDVGWSDSTVVPVWINNTPPSVQILSPANGLTYDETVTTVLPLSAMVVDAEHALGELSCAWQVILHHNEHTHPEPFDTNCHASATLLPHGGECEPRFYEIAFTVTDPLGLERTVSHFLYPADDCNLNGCLDDDDIAEGKSADKDGNGVPDECQFDCNGNGIPDPVDIVVGMARDRNSNGLPDECESQIAVPDEPLQQN